MMDQIRTALQQSRGTLLPDAVGLASLVIMLVVALHLPNVL